MSLPVFIDEGLDFRKVRPHYLPLLFDKMRPGLLERCAPGDQEGMFYPLHLGSPYRLAPESNPHGKGGGIFIYDHVQKEAWKKIEDVGGYILIDHIVESFFGRVDMVEHFHKGMQEANLDPTRVVLLNGNLQSQSRYNLLADQLGIRERAHVIPYNGCFWVLKAHNQSIGAEQSRARLERAKDMIGRDRQKIFVTFNGKGRPHRTYVILRMIADGYDKDGYISLLGHESSDSPSEAQIARQIWPFPDAERLMPEIPGFIERLPLTIDISRAHSRAGSKLKLVLPWASPDPDIYDQTYFSVVLDTSFTDTGTVFHTPIAFKSFMNLSPFVYFGNCGGLQALREIGFRTFAPFVNEDYDTIADDTLRIEAAYREFQRLASLERAELDRGLREIWPTLEHNYALILSPDLQGFSDDWNARVSDQLPGAARLDVTAGRLAGVGP